MLPWLNADGTTSERVYHTACGDRQITAGACAAPVGDAADNGSATWTNDRLGSMMDASRDDVLACMDFPREPWAQISSTNPVERVNKEIERRSDVVGIFPNDATIIRLVGALMIETNAECAVARRYMGLEALARITDTHNVRLPAVAT